MCARTNDYKETQTMANGGSATNGALEWASPRTIYWYPTPSTPN